MHYSATPVNQDATVTRMWIHDSAAGHPLGVSAQRFPGFGQRLREAISAVGSNPHKLSKDLGIAYTTVDAWLRDVSVPRAENLEMLAEAVKQPSHWLLHGDARPSRAMQPYPSLSDFLKSQTLELDERENLLSISCAFGDPGQDYWWQALGAYRSAKRLALTERAQGEPPTARRVKVR